MRVVGLGVVGAPSDAAPNVSTSSWIGDKHGRTFEQTAGLTPILTSISDIISQQNNNEVCSTIRVLCLGVCLYSSWIYMFVCIFVYEVYVSV